MSCACQTFGYPCSAHATANLILLENGLDALFVDFTCSYPCRFFFSTLLTLFKYPRGVVPQKPHLSHGSQSSAWEYVNYWDYLKGLLPESSRIWVWVKVSGKWKQGEKKQRSISWWIFFGPTPIWLWVKTNGTISGWVHHSFSSILVGIGMFTGGTGF